MTGQLPPVPDKLQWYLLPRTPLKGVTVDVSQSLYVLTPQSCGPAPLLLRVGVARKSTITLGLGFRRCMVQLRVDLSPYNHYYLRVLQPLNLGSTDPSSHCGAMLLGDEEYI